ncbi:hypothetical protein AC781_08900 [Akkermansia glycaniphila]|nr:hypothetical protein AC781_08900 [Akkermansia glycaniphila]
MWGLDIMLVALAWGLAYSKMLWIIGLPGEPLFLLCVCVWGFVLIMRMLKVIIYKSDPHACWRPEFYQARFIPLAYLIIAALLAALWLGLYQVGIGLLTFCSIPALCTALALMVPYLWKNRILQTALIALSFAGACSAPAWYYSITAPIANIILFPPTLCFAALVMLHLLSRHAWLQQGQEQNRIVGLLPVFLLALLLACLILANIMPPYERCFYYTIAIGAACLQVLDRYRHRMTTDQLFAIGWLSLALPALSAFLFQN